MASASASVGISGGAGVTPGAGGASAGVIEVKTDTRVNSGVAEESLELDEYEEDEDWRKHTNEELTGALRSFSVCVICPECKKCGATTIKPIWNNISCLMVYLMAEFWFCYTCYNKKDWTCYEAKHYCSSCKVYLDRYQACC